jgi:dihydroorotate dehydrogenase (fumarate)
VNLATRYLGLSLPHPIMPGASPLVDDLDTVKRLADAGAAAIVMHSLFEEQLAGDALASQRHHEENAHSHPEAASYFPESALFALGPDAYLEQIRKIKEAVRLPVIGSLNGSTPGGWLDYARLIEQAGAAALELNLYVVPVDPGESGAALEARELEIVRAVKQSIRIPLAVKLAPFYTSRPNMAKRFAEAGADGLVVFNRFHHPDIDAEKLEARPALHLSTSDELPARLGALALLAGRVQADLAVTGGVHSGLDAAKAVMAGAHAVQTVSALLAYGPKNLTNLVSDLRTVLEEHGYDSLEQARGCMSFDRCPDPSVYQRANYLRTLHGWQANPRLFKL